MLDTYKEIIANQYEATFCTLAVCVRRCPESNWNAPIGERTFSQVAFHALFFADVYLGKNLDALRQQAFHHDQASLFADYEELEDRAPQASYEKSFIESYLQHCRDKAAGVIAEETVQSLQVRPGFDWQKFSRAELHPYNIRHIHHHVAQLSLRLRIDSGIEIPWVASGWRKDFV